jgi:hypothetical protein
VETPERTRVALEQRNLDRHGYRWESVRDGVNNEAGWPLYLQRSRSAVERHAGRRLQDRYRDENGALAPMSIAEDALEVTCNSRPERRIRLNALTL